ncbi:MAG TPA: hypothetical protein VHQ87_05360, partial [Rhizobacter sp.]|nr:hypothetical protein [Rhizobacter sp.]
AGEQSELGFDKQKKEENYTIPGPGTGPVTSSQQSHLAKLRHTEPGVHETRDAPAVQNKLIWWARIGAAVAG